MQQVCPNIRSHRRPRTGLTFQPRQNDDGIERIRADVATQLGIEERHHQHSAERTADGKSKVCCWWRIVLTGSDHLIVMWWHGFIWCVTESSANLPWNSSTSLYAYRYSLVDLSVFVNKRPSNITRGQYVCVRLRYVTCWIVDQQIEGNAEGDATVFCLGNQSFDLTWMLLSSAAET